MSLNSVSTDAWSGQHMRPQWRKLLAEGISQKISPSLVSKPQIPASAKGLCWICKMRKMEENIELPHKLNADCVCMIFMSQVEKKGKDEKWREINIIGLARPLVSFGELRLSTITVINQESRVREKKARSFLPLFLPLFISFTPFLSPSTSMLFYFSPSPFPVPNFVPLYSNIFSR